MPSNNKQRCFFFLFLSFLESVQKSGSNTRPRKSKFIMCDENGVLYFHMGIKHSYDTGPHLDIGDCEIWTNLIIHGSSSASTFIQF